MMQLIVNVQRRTSPILVSINASNNFSSVASAVMIISILFGLAGIVPVYAKLTNNSALTGSTLGTPIEDLKNENQQLTNNNQTVNLSNTTNAFHPRMYAAGKSVYVIWEDRATGMSVVFFKRSIDNGATFGPAIALSNRLDYSIDPQISASGHVVYAVWQHYNSEILLKKSTDNGSTFGPLVKVAGITSYAKDLQLAASGDNLFVLWQDANSGSIQVKKSTNGGVSFGPTIKLTDVRSAASNPTIYAYGATLYVIWTKDYGLAGRSIMLSRTTITNETNNLTSAIKISNTTQEPSSISSPKIVSWGKNVFILWEDDATQHRSVISLTQSNDSGATFGPARELSDNNNNDNRQNFAISFNPEIATAHSNLYIKYQDVLAGILLKKSTNGGVSFGSATRLVNDTAVADLNIAAAENGFVYVLWENTDTGNNNIFFKRSSNNGTTFGPAIDLSNNSAGQPLPHPVLSVLKNHAYVLWEDLSPGSSSILLKKSADNGTTFGPLVKVAGITSYAKDLQLAASGDNLFVLWQDANSGSIQVKKSTNGGVSFGPAAKLSDTTSAASDANIVALGTNVYVVWKDIISDNYNILFKKSTDNGATFGQAITISKNSTAAISNLGIAALGTNVYVVWKDIISDNYNILFKKSTDNGATFGQAITISKKGFDPHISVSTTKSVYIVWQDFNYQGTNKILISKSTDNGATFGQAITISKNSTAAISNLGIAAMGTNVYVVWKASSSTILKRSTDNSLSFGPEKDLGRYFDSPINPNSAMDLRLVLSQNFDVYLGWNQPILSPVDNSSTLNSDVYFARVQPAVLFQGNIYNNNAQTKPATQTTTPEGPPPEQLLSLARPAHLLDEAVWFYANYWKGPLTHILVDELVKRRINTIYFSAPNIGGWDNSSKVSNYVDFIDYARAKGMRVLGVTLEDPSVVFSPESELRKTLGDFIKLTKNSFDGYVIDVEPQAVPGADVHVYLLRYIYMSKILRDVADQYHKEFIDSIPTWYHTVLKQIGVSIGVNALSSTRLNLIDYTYPTTEGILNNLNDVRSEISALYTVNLMITPGHGAPQLSGQEIPRTIITLKSNMLPIAFDEAQYLLNLDSGLFP